MLADFFKALVRDLLRVTPRMIAAVLCIGSVGGFFNNLKFLQRHGFDHSSSWFALAAMVGMVGIFAAFSYFLVISFKMRRDHM